MDVVKDEHEWLLRGECLQQAAQAGEILRLQRLWIERAHPLQRRAVQLQRKQVRQIRIDFKRAFAEALIAERTQGGACFCFARRRRHAEQRAQ